MARFLHQFDTFTIRKNHTFYLALSWAFGLGFGALTFRYGKDHLISLMPSVLSSRLSIVGLASAAILPFLFSVFAVYASIPWLMTIFCFAKAFLYTYISCGIYALFGSARWLLQGLLLCVDTMSIPVLYLYWLRHITGCRPFRFSAAAGYLAVLIGIVILGYYWISPLTAVILF